MWQTGLIYSATLTLRIYVLDAGTACVASDYFLITLDPTLFPDEGLLKHCIYFIASSFARLFQPPQAISFAWKNLC